MVAGSTIRVDAGAAQRDAGGATVAEKLERSMITITLTLIDVLLYSAVLLLAYEILRTMLVYIGDAFFVSRLRKRWKSDRQWIDPQPLKWDDEVKREDG